MTIKNTLLASGLLAASALMASSAVAQPFDIHNVGNWTAITGGQFVGGLNTPTITWGEGVNGGPQSGYSWSPLSVTGIPTEAALTSTQFVIGRFTHNNFTIGDGQSPSDVTLTLNVTIEDNGNPVATPQFSFVFKHNETPNLIDQIPGICPTTGGAIPAVGCPDVVSLPSAFAAQDVDLGPGIGVKTMQIIGFLLDDGDGVYEPLTDISLVSEFITQESQANYAYLLVQFVNPPTRAPEPGSIGLLGLGLAGLGWMGARRRKSA